jgi:hypothetical protein
MWRQSRRRSLICSLVSERRLQGFHSKRIPRPPVALGSSLRAELLAVNAMRLFDGAAVQHTPDTREDVLCGKNLAPMACRQ